MKHIRLSIFVLFAVVFFSACPGGSVVTKSELEIFCFGSIPLDKDETYPKLIQDLVAPLTEAGDSKLNIGFSPVTLIRKDINKEIELNFLAKPGVNYDKILAFERAVKTFFNETKADPVLSQPSAPRAIDVFRTYLEKNKGKANLLVFSKDDNKYEGCKTYASISNVRSSIAKLLIESPGQQIVVVIEPQNISPPLPAQSTSPSPTPDIATEIEKNRKDLEKLKPIEELLVGRVNDNPDDYVALYELALVCVYMSEDHLVSFRWLEQAAEAAIRVGEAKNLSMRIGRDLQGGRRSDRAIWKMATHKDHWEPVMEALSSNGKTPPTARPHNDGKK